MAVQGDAGLCRKVLPQIPQAEKRADGMEDLQVLPAQGLAGRGRAGIGFLGYEQRHGGGRPRVMREKLPAGAGSIRNKNRF